MPRRHLGCLLLTLLLLSACESSPGSVHRQVIVDWPEQDLVFVADLRLGRVQSFRQGGAGAPVLFAQTQQIARSGLRDIRLDAAQGSLWVLADDGVYRYAARGLALQERYAIAAPRVAVLRVVADGVLLLDRMGEPVDRIDQRAAVAHDTAAVDRG